MLPAHQSLETADSVRAQGHNGLVVNSKFLALDSPSQICLQLQTCHSIVAHSRVEYLIACLAKCLGTVHRRVGVAEKLFGLLITCCTNGDSNAYRAEHLVTA